MAAPPSVFSSRRRGKAILPGQADHSATGSPQQLEIVTVPRAARNSLRLWQKRSQTAHSRGFRRSFFTPQQHAANARQNGIGEQGALDLFLPYKGGERKHPPFAGHHRTAFADPTF